MPQEIDGKLTFTSDEIIDYTVRAAFKSDYDMEIYFQRLRWIIHEHSIFLDRGKRNGKKYGF